MARPIRIQYPGAIYHVTSRGHERKNLFQDEADREIIRRKLAVSLGRYQVRLYAYVLIEFVDYGPLGAWLGEGKTAQKQAYKEFIESGMARTDEELAEAMRLSTKAIGGEAFCRWVEGEQQGRLAQYRAPEEIRMRRQEVGIDPEFILQTVGQVCGMEKGEFQRRQSRQRGGGWP